MTFTVTQHGDVNIVEVEGQLIVSNRQELKSKVLEQLDKGARKVLVDFGRTSYIDSSGLGVLVWSSSVKSNANVYQVHHGLARFREALVRLC